MMIKKKFYFDLSGKKFGQKVLRSKNFGQKLRHQVIEAEAVEGEALITLLVNLEFTRKIVKKKQ